MTGTPASIAIVGASLAGLSTARALRARGYDGELVIIGDEPHRPYDRPPLSKDFLSFASGTEDIALESDDEQLEARWVLGTAATGLRPRPGGGAVVELAGGETVEADGVVIATGATARRSMTGGDLPGVHVLRTLDDAAALRDDILAAARDGGHVVVVGGGFIGSEVAATARQVGCAVTLLVAESAPMEGPLGPFATAVTDLHTAHGVSVRTGIHVLGVERTGDGLAVVLQGEQPVAATVVVLGLGAVPATSWLVDSGLALIGSGAVECDPTGATNLPGVYGVGDCAAWWDTARGRHEPVGHWTAAKERAAVVAARLLGEDRLPRERAPYFWSDLYDCRIQLAGDRIFADSDPIIEVGDVADGSFAAVYHRDGAPVAVVGFGQVRHVTAVRKRIVLPPSVIAPSPTPAPATVHRTEGVLS